MADGTSEVYYPSLLVTLRLRFDEAVVSYTTDAMPSPQSSRSMADAQTNISVKLNAQPVFLAGEADELSRVFDIIPAGASIELAPYRQASKFHLTIPFEDCPIDPRLLRACGVEIYLDAVKAEDFGDGVTGGTKNGRSASILVPGPDNLLMVGTTDDWTLTHDDKGSWVELVGRDLRGVLLDSNVDPALMVNLDLTKPIDDVVRQIIAKHPLLTPIVPADGADHAEVLAAFNAVAATGLTDVKTPIIVWTNLHDWPLDSTGARKVPSPAAADDVTAMCIPVVNRPGYKAPKGNHINAPGQGGPGSSPKIQQVPFGQQPAQSTRQTQNAQNGGVRKLPRADVNTINYWDLICQFTYLCGAIPYFDGMELRVRPSRSLFDVLDAEHRAGPGGGWDQRIPTPFLNNQPRDSVDVNGVKTTRAIRQMVFGRNVSKLEFQRKFNGWAPRIVEAISLDMSASKPGFQKLNTAQWPKAELIQLPDPATGRQQAQIGGGKATSRTKHHNSAPAKSFINMVAPSGFRTEVSVLRYPVSGIKDPATLEMIARGIFEELMRGEISGTCSTSDLASFASTPGQGGNNDPDLLKLRPGDPIEFLYAHKNGSGAERLPTSKMQFDTAVGDIADKIGSRTSPGDMNFARLLVASQRNMLGVLSFYRTSKVKYTWKKDGGSIEIEMDFQNYVEVRMGQAKDSGPVSAEDQATAQAYNETQQRRRDLTVMPTGIPKAAGK